MPQAGEGRTLNAVRAGLRCSDVDLWQREITVRGKGSKDRIVRIGHYTARSLERYQCSRSRHGQAWRSQLWLGADNREPLTAAGIYQMITRPEGDLMELNGWTSPRMLRRYSAGARSARARRTYDRVMTGT